ncbi:MAG TPA: recombinase family protein [Candidatus Acidoferrales bacterium]|nr:recombinase family protein [Candidatus Acidoferrales bacterium]
MKTAIYARVSTANGQDPEMQLRELREYCQRRLANHGRIHRRGNLGCQGFTS